VESRGSGVLWGTISGVNGRSEDRPVLG